MALNGYQKNETRPASKFETKSCTRCGGGGHYSYNQISGSRCFKCGGSGLQHTLRGAAARKFFRESMLRPARTVQPGEQMMATVGIVGPDRWHLVKSVESSLFDHTQGSDRLRFELVRKGQRHGYVVSPDTLVQTTTGQEELDAKMAAALAYQATLTEAGKPAKRRAA